MLGAFNPKLSTSSFNTLNSKHAQNVGLLFSQASRGLGLDPYVRALQEVLKGIPAP